MGDEKLPAASDTPAKAEAEQELKVDEANKVVGGTENITFNYGAIEVHYTQQKPSGG